MTGDLKQKTAGSDEEVLRGDSPQCGRIKIERRRGQAGGDPGFRAEEGALGLYGMGWEGLWVLVCKL